MNDLASAGARAYKKKTDDFFEGVRDDFTGELPVSTDAKNLDN